MIVTRQALPELWRRPLPLQAPDELAAFARDSPLLDAHGLVAVCPGSVQHFLRVHQTKASGGGRTRGGAVGV